MAWTIPPGAIAPHLDGTGGTAHRANAIEGTVAELVTLPGIARVVFLADGDPASALVFPVPTHLVGRDRLRVGQPGVAALMPDAIHLMRA